MLTTPDETPVTVPDVPTVAIPVDELLHVPPGDPSASATVAPTQTSTGPPGVIPTGDTFTVTGAPTAQEPMVYEIDVVPAATPVTTPATTLAVPGAVLDHTPPPTDSVNANVLPSQTVAEDGVSAAGVTETVTVLTAAQPNPFE